MLNHDIDLEIYNALLGAIYEAANNPAQWNDFLARLAHAFNGHGAVLRIFDSQSFCPSVSINHGYDDSFSQAYLDHYYQLDITTPFLKDSPEGTVLNRIDIISDDLLTNSEFYTDFAGKWDMYHMLGSHFIQRPEGTARIAVHRSAGCKPFSAKDKYFMSLLIPHLQRAFDISRCIQRIKVQSESSADVLNRLPFGVVLVDKNSRPVLVNQQAQALDQQEGGINITAKALSAGTSKETQALHQLIEQAAQGEGDNPGQGGALFVGRADSPLPLSVLVTPLNSTQNPMGFADPQAAAAVFISDPVQQQQISPEILSSLYGLTKAEARLATELAQGRSLDEIAAAFHVSKHTLRSQLKSIFSKTGLKRQPDLIRLILGGPATLNI